MTEAIKVKITENMKDALETAISRHFWDKGIRVCRLGGGWRTKDAIKWGVNWSAMGTQTPEDTLKYARIMMEAAKLTEVLNSMEIAVDYSEDDTDMDEYNETIELMMGVLSTGNYENLRNVF